MQVKMNTCNMFYFYLKPNYVFGLLHFFVNLKKLILVFLLNRKVQDRNILFWSLLIKFFGLVFIPVSSLGLPILFVSTTINAIGMGMLETGEFIFVNKIATYLKLENLCFNIYY